MSSESPPDTVGNVPEQSSIPDPEVAIKVMLAEVEIIRAQVGLGPVEPPEQAMLRDLSPFGR